MCGSNCVVLPPVPVMLQAHSDCLWTRLATRCLGCAGRARFRVPRVPLVHHRMHYPPRRHAVDSLPAFPWNVPVALASYYISITRADAHACVSAYAPKYYYHIFEASKLQATSHFRSVEAPSYVYSCIHAYVCSHADIHVYMDICIYIYIYIHINMHIYICIDICIYLYIYMYTCMFVYIHIYI